MISKHVLITEYGGKWKAVHYFAKNFFANVALTAFDDDSVMTIYSISDEMTPIEPVTLVVNFVLTPLF